MQKEACRNFAEVSGRLSRSFREGVSGFKKSAKDRDELQKIQQAAMEGKFDILLVFMFDRLGRRDDETPFIVEWSRRQASKSVILEFVTVFGRLLKAGNSFLGKLLDNLPALTFCKVAAGFFLHGDVILFDLSFGRNTV